MLSWTSKTVKVTDLKEYKSNPRIFNEKGLSDLKASINKFGLAEPICCNPDLTIIGGHARKKTLIELGIKEVLIHVPERKLNEKEIKELNVRLNKNQAGNWDFDVLANDFEMEELKEWGFDESELDINLWNKIDEEKLDEVPEVQKEAVSKSGDLFLFDNKHRLLCGDSTKGEDVELLMDGKKINLLLTDPPYGVDYSAKNVFLNTVALGKRIEKDIENDTHNAEDTVAMWRGYFRNVKVYLTPGANYYINFSGDKLILLLLLLREKEINMPERQILVWVKNNHVLGRSNYNYKHEFILYGWNEGGGHKYYGGFDTTVWEVDKPLKNDLHPTMKPIGLLTKAINHGSAKNDIVYDGFLGSGSSLIACEQTNRTCYGMEIDPIYIDVILKRYHKLYPKQEIKCLNRKFNFDKLWQN